MGWQTGLTEKIDVQNERLNKNIVRLSKLTAKRVREITINTAKKFAGAAANRMPPGSSSSSAKIPNAKLYRRIRDLSNPEEWNGQHGEIWRNARFGKNKYAFAVYASTPRKRVKFFRNFAEAKRFAAIPNRGAARYGWLQGVVALGGAARSVTPASFPFAGNSDRLRNVAGSTDISGGDDIRIEIENHSTAAGQMHLLQSELAAKRIANAGLARALKAEEKKMEQELFK